MINDRITKKAFFSFLNDFSADKTLIYPINNGKTVEYREPADNSIPEIYDLPDDCIAYNSIKSFYFPQTELMFSVKNNEMQPNANPPEYVIFGARPCDLEALRVMNTVYTTGKYADPFFLKRLESNFLVAVGCKTLKPECFCNEMNITKEYSDFCDIMLEDIGDSYIIKFLSDKGKQIIKSYPCPATATEPFPCLASSPDIPQTAALQLDPEKSDTEFFDIIDWEKVTETCQGCGICTYICPTCYCFDFKDTVKHGEAKRYKCWDSCMYPKFTLHASGHNPRSVRYERYRQRVLHKYKYVPKNFEGTVACTGCGRCIRSCPVGINIKNIVKTVTEA